jgi:hypothetical protein
MHCYGETLACRVSLIRRPDWRRRSFLDAANPPGICTRKAETDIPGKVFLVLVGNIYNMSAGFTVDLGYGSSFTYSLTYGPGDLS